MSAVLAVEELAGWGVPVPALWACGVGGHGPVVLVGELVVGAAQCCELVEVGAAAVVPWRNVVGVAPGGGPVTSGEDASTVAACQRCFLLGGGEAFGASHLERVAVLVDEQAAKVGAWQQPLQRCG